MNISGIFFHVMFILFIFIVSHEIYLLSQGEDLDFFFQDIPKEYELLVLGLDILFLFGFYHWAWVSKK